MAENTRFVPIEAASVVRLAPQYVVEWKERGGSRRFLMNFAKELHDNLRSLVILKQIYPDGVAYSILFEHLRIHASRVLEKIAIPRYENTYIMECHWSTPDGPFVEILPCNTAVILGICAGTTFEIEEKLFESAVKNCKPLLEILDRESQKPGFSADGAADQLANMDDDDLPKA